jgi:hypothetical protein
VFRAAERQCDIFCQNQMREMDKRPHLEVEVADEPCNIA